MYQELIYTGLANAFLGTLLAVVVWGIFRYSKNSQLASLLWIFVFLKFLTPPFLEMPLLPANYSQERVSHNDPSPPNDFEPTVVENVESGFNEELVIPSEAIKNQDLDFESTVAIPEKGTVSDVKLYDEETYSYLTGKQEDLFSSSIGPVETVSANRMVGSRFSLSNLFTFYNGFLLWMAGSLVSLFFMLWRGWQFERLIQQVQETSHSLQPIADQIAQKMGLPKSPEVKMIDAPVTPMIWSFGRKPVIIVPEKLNQDVSHDKMAMVLTHELAHIKRNDHLFRWIELAVLSLFWWFPIVKWIRKQWHIVQEDCCDAWVIRLFPECRVDYGETLLKAAQFLQHTKSPVWANKLWTNNSLKERIETILQSRNDVPLSRSMKLATLFLLTPLLVFTLGQAQEENLLLKTEKTISNNQLKEDNTNNKELIDEAGSYNEEKRVQKNAQEKPTESLNNFTIHLVNEQNRIAKRLVDGWVKERQKLLNGQFDFKNHMRISEQDNREFDSMFNYWIRTTFDDKKVAFSLFNFSMLDSRIFQGDRLQAFYRKRPDDYYRIATASDMNMLFRPSYPEPAIPLKNELGSKFTGRVQYQGEELRFFFESPHIHFSEIPQDIVKFQTPHLLESIGEGRFRLTFVSKIINQNKSKNWKMDRIVINETKGCSIESRSITYLKKKEEEIGTVEKIPDIELRIESKEINNVWVPVKMEFKNRAEKLDGVVHFQWWKVNEGLEKDGNGDFKLKPLKMPGPNDDPMSVSYFRSGKTVNSNPFYISGDDGRKYQIVKISPSLNFDLGKLSLKSKEIQDDKEFRETVLNKLLDSDKLKRDLFVQELRTCLQKSSNEILLFLESLRAS